MSSSAVHVIHVPAPVANHPEARSRYVLDALQNNVMKRRKMCLDDDDDDADARCFVAPNVVEFGAEFRRMYACDPYKIVDVLKRRSVAMTSSLNSTS